MDKILGKVKKGEPLSRAETFNLMNQLQQGKQPAELVGSLLLALKKKGESVEEITGFVQSLRAAAVQVPKVKEGLMDVCGTGGDNLGTFNISTTVAFVVAASGQGIAKHGNRSVSSKSGSFDVLEALGIKFSSDPKVISQSLSEHNMAFLFAPAFHPALKAVSTIRKNLGVPTVFNVLGPLINPIPVKKQIIGVYDRRLIGKVCSVLNELESTDVMVVHGENGMDEFSISGPTFVAQLKNKELSEFVVEPKDFGLSVHPIEHLKGGTAEDNAKDLLAVLGGESSAKRDAVLLNAAAALVVGGVARDYKEGVERARETIDSGNGLNLLERMRRK